MDNSIFKILILIMFAMSGILPSIVHATPEYAEETGKSCSVCHIDPSGGGPLTLIGENYLGQKGLFRKLSKTQHLIRLIIGFLHMTTAIAWFGTIIYVHTLLKPAYAAKGLPHGELMLGWISITILAITGTLLTISRVSSLRTFYESRFGILLSIKIVLFLIMAATAATVTFIIGPRLRKKISSPTKSIKPEMTKEDVLALNGTGDSPIACIIYKDNIYEVTRSRLWKGGNHMRKHLAGTDLTDALKLAPHGEDKIFSLPLVGRVVQQDITSKKRWFERVFFLFAYINLILVFCIIFVISLWRWW